MSALIDWDDIDLVVFDVDGTLYDAARLRRAMLRRLLAAAWHERSLRAVRVLRAFRLEREALGNEEDVDFQVAQYTRTAARVRCSEDEVRALAREWMERQPLALLRACRRPHVEDLFTGLRLAGKRIAVLSDYPAVRKLRVLGLRADVVVSATDSGIGKLKPHPIGLESILARTGVPPQRTLMIGDRVDRDAAVAERAGTRALILARVRKPCGVPTFASYGAAVFRPLFQAPALVPA